MDKGVKRLLIGILWFMLLFTAGIICLSNFWGLCSIGGRRSISSGSGRRFNCRQCKI